MVPVSERSPYLVDNGKNPGLALLSAVGADTQVYFFGISVGLIGSCESKDDVRRGGGDVFKDGRYFRTGQRHTNKALDLGASPVGVFRAADPADGFDSIPMVFLLM